MHLFIETPEMRARRATRAASAQDSAHVTGAAGSSGQHGASGSRYHLFDEVEAPVSDGQAPDGEATRFGGAAAEVPQARVVPDGGYSLEQESYQEELAFNERRSARRRRFAVLRVLAVVVAVPLVLVVVFVGTYAVTCILDGATPAELVELMGELARDVETLVRDVLADLV